MNGQFLLGCLSTVAFMIWLKCVILLTKSIISLRKEEKQLDMKHYYQTTPMTDAELLEAQGRAISQEDRIYHLLKNSPSTWTAWEIKETIDFEELEITSIPPGLVQP